MRITLLLLALSLMVSGCASYRNYENYDMQGLSQSERVRERGIHYLLGQGVARNNQKAFYYFKQAADNNDALAQNEAAYMFAAGKGTTRDLSQALQYYKKAANYGLASAQYNLGLMYLRGMGTKPNRKLAKEWIQKAASNGFGPAQRQLKRMKV